VCLFIWALGNNDIPSPQTLFLQDVRLRVQGFQDGMEDEQPHGNPASEIFAVEADPDIAVLAADMVGL
jgi:hypothetical protein